MLFLKTTANNGHRLQNLLWWKSGLRLTKEELPKAEVDLKVNFVTSCVN